MGLVYVNGKLIPEKDAKISVFDHGVLYGDGVFEGVRGYNGRIFKLKEHLERLYNSAKAIMLEIPLGFAELENAIIQTVRANKLKDCYIRIVVTRGVGDLGLDPRKCKTPTLFIIANKIELFPKRLYKEGISIVTAATRRNLPESVNPAIKSLNYLNNILAKIDAINSGVLEALVLNTEGYVSECTGENIFIYKKGTLFTPPVSAGALEGVTRDTVIEIALNQNIRTEEVLLTRYHLYIADECFLTGTAAEIMPVTKIDGRKIGSGKIGSFTQKISEEFQKVVEVEGIPVY